MAAGNCNRRWPAAWARGSKGRNAQAPPAPPGVGLGGRRGGALCRFVSLQNDCDSKLCARGPLPLPPQ